MKKTYTAALFATCVTASSLAIAAPKTIEAIADVIPGSCQVVQIPSYGSSLLGNWAWENGTTQTKFGGDADYMVTATVDIEGIPTTEEFKVEFEVVQFDEYVPVDDYIGTFVYRCNVAQTEVEGECYGAVLNLRTSIRNAAAEHFNVLPDSVYDLQASIMGVGIKAMNPAYEESNKRQNYPKVDICTPILE